MKEHIYNKLVRDNVPDIIREQGGTPVIRTLGDEEYVQCLENKLREEVGEFLEERDVYKRQESRLISSCSKGKRNFIDNISPL